MLVNGPEGRASQNACSSLRAARSCPSLMFRNWSIFSNLAFMRFCIAISGSENSLPKLDRHPKVRSRRWTPHQKIALPAFRHSHPPPHLRFSRSLRDVWCPCRTHSTLSLQGGFAGRRVVWHQRPIATTIWTASSTDVPEHRFQHPGTLRSRRARVEEIKQIQ